MEKTKANSPKYKIPIRTAPQEIIMTGDDFRAAIEKIGVSQEGFGRLIGVRGRTVRSWIAEEFPVPKVVALFARLMLKTKTNPEDLL
ncbi:DNA-binding transcriptional regulator YiaG [Bradyrhizobium sp. AZCC 1719]|uniref:helix-turn-helix domain-containing protein n=1 Tax=Bradyrhizobium sp. AZCC 1719 TaxID=3117028 RepID=UPI002FF137AB